MRLSARSLPLLALALLPSCGDSHDRLNASAMPGRIAVEELAPPKKTIDSTYAPLLAARDSLAALDSLAHLPPWKPKGDTLGPRVDSFPELLAGKGKARRKFLARLRPGELASWRLGTPDPLPGALLPSHRIVAYYGNPLSKRMGILGQIPPDEMMARLEQTAAEWQRADSTTRVMPALHLIVTVAQGQPGPGGLYRLRMTDELIERVAGWAESKGWILFLDVQTGHSTVADELPRLEKYLERPWVHLALDPEFAMKNGGVPGKRIGTLDAEDVNHAIRWLADIVERHDLPPKVLVVHRFTQPMLTNARRIWLDPRVQVVIDMDGFGAPNLKQDAYRFFIVPEPVQYTGFKLFYKNDKPLMTPSQVLELYPEPMYIQYQ